MAARSVTTSNTLEQFRTTFNSLSGTDIGDLASLGTTEKGSILRGSGSHGRFKSSTHNEWHWYQMKSARTDKIY